MNAPNKDAPTAPSIEVRVIRLSQPLETHNGEVRELTLKDPGGALMLRIGLPWRQIVVPEQQGSDQKFEIEYIPDKMALYMEAMTGIDKISLGALQARDVNACFVAVMNMLQPASF